jgi:hypothetical protein
LPNIWRFPPDGQYSRYLVCKIPKLGSVERRRVIIHEFEGSVVGMVRHKEAGKALADTFEVYAGEWERAVFVSGLSGKEVTPFGASGSGTGARRQRQRQK